MGCDADKYHATWAAFLANNTHNNTWGAKDDDEALLQYYVYRVVVPAVCALGILGNVLNLVVLLQHQIRRSMDYMEKSAHMGIVALAVSDMLFCIVAFPMAFITKEDPYVGSRGLFSFYYHGYHQPLINIFMLSSTWLVVVMAGARYLAICWPLHARGYINLPATFVAIVCVFLASVLIGLPEFWRFNMHQHPCPLDQACTCYIQGKATSIVYTNTGLKFSFYIFKGIIGTAIPLVVLTFCNINLIKALRQSSKMQRKYRANAPKESSHRITLTLITMVILFFILVCPSTMLVFFKDMGMQPSSREQHRAYQTVTHIFNLMQAINFSINFLLYCLINVHFRKVIRHIVCCLCFRDRHMEGGYHSTNTNNHSMVTQTECLHIEEVDTHKSHAHAKK